MEKNKVVQSYGIPSDKKVGNFVLASISGIAEELIAVEKNIMESVETGKRVPLEFKNYKIDAKATLHENGLVIDVNQYTDAGVCKYDDAGSSKIYIFNDGITYVVTKVDFRLNKECDINTDKVEELDAKVGAVVQIPAPLIEATSPIQKVKNSLTRKKREIIGLKRELYLSKLQVALDQLNLSTYNK